MEAMRIHKFGGSDVLERDDIERPLAQSGEILVRVMAASVNPVDFKMRAGGYAPQEQSLPIILGRDLAGVVEQIGLGVTNFGLGEDVFALLGRDRGGYAEYVIVKAEEAARKPNNLSYIEAAAVPLAALTAWQGLFDQGGLSAGQRVLIHGGAGGVGHLAVQLAKAVGAFVATTASADDLEFLRRIGADQVIDYKGPRFEEQVSNIDIVFDLIGGETQERSWAVLRPGGIIVSTLKEPSQEEAKRRGMRGVHYMAEANGKQLTMISALIEEGKVRPQVQATFLLEQAAEAQDLLENDHVRGKIVLAVAPDPTVVPAVAGATLQE